MPGVPDLPETSVLVLRDQGLTSAMVRLVHRRPVERCNDRCAYRHDRLRRAVLRMIDERLTALKLRPAPPFSASRTRTYRPLPGHEAYELQVAVDEGGVLPGLEAALREIERLRRHGFTADELAASRTAILSGYWQQIDPRSQTSATLTEALIDHVVMGRPLIDPGLDASLLAKLLETVTLCDLHAEMSDLTGAGNRLAVVQGPPWAELPDPTEVKAVLERVGAQPVDDYVPAPFVLKPLVRNKPAGGPVVDEKLIEPLDVHEWRLANGVRVLIKSTAVDSGMVQVTAFSPGGHSLVADADYPAALLAAEVLNSSGFGDWSEGELRRMMGEGATFRLGLNEREEGFTGKAVVGRLRALLELMHLAFSEPRVDPRVLDRKKAAARSNLRRSRIDPDAFLADRWTALYYGAIPAAVRCGGRRSTPSRGGRDPDPPPALRHHGRPGGGDRRSGKPPAPAGHGRDVPGRPADRAHGSRPRRRRAPPDGHPPPGNPARRPAESPGANRLHRGRPRRPRAGFATAIGG